MNNPHLMMLADACTHMIEKHPYEGNTTPDTNRPGKFLYCVAWADTLTYLDFLAMHDYDNGELGETITEYREDPEKYHDDMLDRIALTRDYAVTGG